MSHSVVAVVTAMTATALESVTVGLNVLSKDMQVVLGGGLQAALRLHLVQAATKGDTDLAFW